MSKKDSTNVSGKSAKEASILKLLKTSCYPGCKTAPRYSKTMKMTKESCDAANKAMFGYLVRLYSNNFDKTAADRNEPLANVIRSMANGNGFFSAVKSAFDSVETRMQLAKGLIKAAAEDLSAGGGGHRLLGAALGAPVGGTLGGLAGAAGAANRLMKGKPTNPLARIAGCVGAGALGGGTIGALLGGHKPGLTGSVDDVIPTDSIGPTQAAPTNRLSEIIKNNPKATTAILAALTAGGGALAGAGAAKAFGGKKKKKPEEKTSADKLAKANVILEYKNAPKLSKEAADQFIAADLPFKARILASGSTPALVKAAMISLLDVPYKTKLELIKRAMGGGQSPLAAGINGPTVPENLFGKKMDSLKDMAGGAANSVAKATLAPGTYASKAMGSGLQSAAGVSRQAGAGAQQFSNNMAKPNYPGNVGREPNPSAVMSSGHLVQQPRGPSPTGYGAGDQLGAAAKGIGSLHGAVATGALNAQTGALQSVANFMKGLGSTGQSVMDSMQPNKPSGAAGQAIAAAPKAPTNITGQMPYSRSSGMTTPSSPMVQSPSSLGQQTAAKSPMQGLSQENLDWVSKLTEDKGRQGRFGVGDRSGMQSRFADQVAKMRSSGLDYDMINNYLNERRAGNNSMKLNDFVGMYGKNKAGGQDKQSLKLPAQPQGKVDPRFAAFTGKPAPTAAASPVAAQIGKRQPAMSP